MEHKISQWRDGRTYYAGIEMRGILMQGSTKAIALRRCQAELAAELADERRMDADERRMDADERRINRQERD